MSGSGPTEEVDDPSLGLPINRRGVLKAAGISAVAPTTYVETANGQSALNVNIRQVNRPEFPEVTVFATVEDGAGNTLSTLSEANFSISETRAGTSNQQPIESLVRPQKDTAGSISTAIVIDKSASMDTGDRMENAIDGGTQFVQEFGPSDEGLLLAIDDTPAINQRWTTSESELTDAISNLTASNNTALFDGVKQAISEAGPRTNQDRIGRSAVVVLADGQDNASTASLSDVVTEANAQNVPVYTIGLGNTINPGNLEELAVETGGQYYQSATGDDLGEIYRAIAESITSEYKITYITENQTTDGQQREVQLQATYDGVSGSDFETYEEPCAPLPSADFDISPTVAVEGQEVTFDGSDSRPNGGQLVKYAWDFNNDGTLDATGETATHTFTEPGSYSAKLTVEKTCGAIDVEVDSIAVADEPVSVVDVSTNTPITEGEVLRADVELKNTQFKKENRSVVLQDFDGNVVDAEPVQVGRGENLAITLEWDTEFGDAKTGNITIRVSDINVDEKVEIQSADIQLSATTGGAPGVVPGGRERVDIELTNSGANALQNFEFGIDSTSIPEGWEIIDSIESDHYKQLNWNSNNAIWSVSELAVGETVDPSVVIEVPEDTPIGETESITVLYRSQGGSTPEATASVDVNTVDRFDPTVHGFGFPNWRMGQRPDHNGSTPNKSEIENVVRDTVISDLSQIGVPTPFGTETALANILYSLVNTGAATNGHCYGMTYAADEYYHNPDEIPVSGVSTASEITDPNMTGQDAVGSDIDYYHNAQLLNTEPVLAILLLKHSQEQIDHGRVLEDIKDAIDDTGTAPIALGNDDGSALHQVLAYDYEVNRDTTDVYLYDSSSPLDTDRSVFGPYSHWRLEPSAGWDIHRDLSLTFDTSGYSTDLKEAHGGIYSNAIYLHDGDRIDNPLTALGTLLVGNLTAVLADVLSGIISFGISVVSDSIGVLEDGDGEQKDSRFNVEVVGPDGETLQTLSEDAAYSNIEYDGFYYVLGAQSGEYKVEVEANTDIKYTVDTNGTIKDGGMINDEITQQASAGDKQRMTAEVPSEEGESGNIEAGSPSTGTWYNPYINENNVVENKGLNKAIRDYLSGNLDSGNLNTVITSYVSGRPIQA